MSPEITIKKDYILIEPKKGTDYSEIHRGVARLFYVDEIPKKIAFGYSVKAQKSFPTMICISSKTLSKKITPTAIK